jgi:hypothetical protein
MSAYQNALTHHHDRADTADAPEKEGTRVESLNTSKRTNGAMPFFLVRQLSHAYGRRWRGSLRACRVPLVFRSLNPVICRSPHLRVGNGLTVHQRHAMTTISTTTPIQSRTEIINSLAGQSDALGALLAVIGILPAVDYQTTLATCSSLANDIASKLAALIGGGA